MNSNEIFKITKHIWILIAVLIFIIALLSQLIVKGLEEMLKPDPKYVEQFEKLDKGNFKIQSFKLIKGVPSTIGVSDNKVILLQIKNEITQECFLLAEWDISEFQMVKSKCEK